jgi:hypothetical protein
VRFATEIAVASPSMNLQEAHKRRSISVLFRDNIEGAEIIFDRFGELKSVDEIACGMAAADTELRTQVRIALFFLGFSDVGLCEIAKSLSHESMISFSHAAMTFFEIEELC